MKSIAIPVLFCALLCGQQPPPQTAPGTPAPQAAPQNLPTPPTVAPDAVVISVAGKKYTAAEVDKIITTLPPQYQMAARSNPQILSQVFFLEQLAAMAEKDGLDKISPYKEALAFQRGQTLAQAEVATHANLIGATPDEVDAYYKAHPEKFQQAKVRVIKIEFNPAPDKGASEGKKIATEAEAKAKIEGLRKQIVDGADFGKLAKENSDDKESGAKGGDFGIMKHDSSYPAPIKDAVFALKAGEMSQPVRLPNGFYLIRVDESTTQPYSEVDSQIAQQIRQQKMSEWQTGIQSQYAVKVENPSYFAPKAPAPLQQVR